jgi:hypothetical protein
MKTSRDGEARRKQSIIYKEPIRKLPLTNVREIYVFTRHSLSYKTPTARSLPARQPVWLSRGTFPDQHLRRDTMPRPLESIVSGLDTAGRSPFLSRGAGPVLMTSGLSDTGWVVGHGPDERRIPVRTSSVTLPSSGYRAHPRNSYV